MKTRVSERGQITVPKAVRERLGLRPGDELDVAEENGRLVARKVSADDPVASVYGTISLPGGTDQFIREIRGPGPDDHGG
jgi:AbrB family looped-hinge helix DNA binding protein